MAQDQASDESNNLVPPQGRRDAAMIEGLLIILCGCTILTLVGLMIIDRELEQLKWRRRDPWGR